MTQTLGQFINCKRLKINQTIINFSKIIGMESSELYDIENDLKKLDHKTLNVISHYLMLDLEETEFLFDLNSIEIVAPIKQTLQDLVNQKNNPVSLIRIPEKLDISNDEFKSIVAHLKKFY